MKVYLHTFGCRANQYDTERMRALLERRGCEAVDRPDEADAFVINSCTVTNEADAELRRAVRRLYRTRPGRPIVVAGCAAALNAEAIRAMGEVTAVVRGQDPEAVASSLGVLPRSAEEFVLPVIADQKRGTRAWLKVQDGCDLRCSYCAIRIARGGNRSRTPEEIVEEARSLAQHHPEISITGIHIGLYGRDLRPKLRLSDLMKQLLEDVPDVRFRLGSIEVSELDGGLVELLEHSDGRLAPHLHVPLQSGSDALLRRMRRPYLRARYLDRLTEVCSRVQPLGLGSDIIVGFPGETTEDHRATVDVVERLPFTYLHVFPFSPKAGTEAARLPDQVPAPVKARRSQELRALVTQKRRAHILSRIGTLDLVVLEEEGAVAVTGDYLKVATDPGLRARGERWGERRGERLQPARLLGTCETDLRAVPPDWN